MEITDFINSFFSTPEFKTGLFLGLPIGLCCGLELTFLIEDLIHFVFDRLKKVRKWHERFDD